MIQEYKNAAQELHSNYGVMPWPHFKEYEEKIKGGAEKKTKEQRNNILTQLNSVLSANNFKSSLLFPEQVMKIYLRKARLS